MTITTLLIDLDDTVYSPNSGIWNAIKYKINDYIQERLNLPRDEIAALRENYFKTYGTTLRGLVINHGIDPQDYLAYVHDVPVEECIQPDPALKSVLDALPQRKIIFTNADSNHAKRVLNAIHITDCFDQIIDIFAMEPYCKPQPESFQKALALSGEFDASKCMLLDDSLRNLDVARELGFITTLVHPNITCGENHWRITSLHEVASILRKHKSKPHKII